MVNATQVKEQNSATHAVAKDFCRIFEQEMDGLYLLSLLLTADSTIAEQCFAGGLQDSGKSSRVFKEWAHSWARRMVVQNAIRTMNPQPADSCATNRAGNDIAGRPEIAAVLALPLFERFVFVMSVLERYSERDCALLLDCARSEVIAARVRALQQIGRAADAYRSATHSAERTEQRFSALTVKVESIPFLATLP